MICFLEYKTVNHFGKKIIGEGWERSQKIRISNKFDLKNHVKNHCNKKKFPRYNLENKLFDTK